MVDVGVGLGLVSAFKLALDKYNEESEEERVRKGVRDSIKQFVFFYDDLGWSQIRNAERFQLKLAQGAEEVRNIAVQADDVLEDQVVRNLREIAGNLDAASVQKIPPSTMGKANGENLKSMIESSRQKAGTVLSLLDD